MDEDTTHDQELDQTHEAFVLALARAVKARQMSTSFSVSDARRLRVPPAEWDAVCGAMTQLCAEARRRNELPEHTIRRVKRIIEDAVPRMQADAASLRAVLVSHCIKAYYKG